MEKKFALIQGNWLKSYTGTGMFLPTNVVICTEEEANKLMEQYYKSHHVDWYCVPITESVKEEFIK